MPFIGQEPLTGAYSVLDDITASATATYNLQLNGGAYSPASANNLLVSLNGVIQKPGSSFTISGSQITFSSALTSSDSIDFIMALGDVLSVGTPTDGTVDGNKLASNIGISTTGNIATTGNLDVNTIRHTNGTTALTIDTAGRIQQPTKPAFSVLVGATTTGKDFTSGPQALDEFTLIEFNIGSHLVLNSGNAKFTAPVGGVYSFNSMLQLGGHTTATHASSYFIIDSTFSGSHNRYHRSINDIAGEDYFTAESAAII